MAVGLLFGFLVGVVVVFVAQTVGWESSVVGRHWYGLQALLRYKWFYRTEVATVQSLLLFCAQQVWSSTSSALSVVAPTQAWGGMVQWLSVA